MWAAADIGTSRIRVAALECGLQLTLGLHYVEWQHWTSKNLKSNVGKFTVHSQRDVVTSCMSQAYSHSAHYDTQ